MKSFIVCLFIALAVAQTCISPKMIVNIKRTYKSSATQEGIQIWQGNYQTGTLIGEWNGNGHDNTIQTYSLCLSSTLHTLVATDGAKDGWYDGSIFEIVTRSGVVILKGTLDSYQQKLFTFYPAFSIKSTDSWKYSAVAQSDNQWTAAGFADSTWTSYAPGSFPEVSSITRYFRATASVPSNKNSFALVDCGVLSKDGVAIYINGQEVYRRNIPTGASGSTPATTVDAVSAYRRVTFPVTSSFLSGSTVTMAVEVHGASATPVAEDFMGILIFVYGPSVSRNMDFTVNAERPADYSGEPVGNAFDGDIQTKWYINPLPIWGEIRFNNGRREWVNRYVLTVGSFGIYRRPTSWKIFGSNDGTNYDLLDARSHFDWEGTRLDTMFEMNTNQKSYEIYRIQVLTSGGTDSEIAEIQFYATTNAYVTPSLSYGTTTVSLIANMDSKQLTPTQNGFQNFAISPALPADVGATFDPVTGAITLIPTAVITAAQYQITASHAVTGQSYTTSVMISATLCLSPNIRFDLFQQVGKAGTTAGDAETVSVLNSAGTQIFTSSLRPTDYTDYNEKTYKFCQAPGIYVFKLTAASSAGFSTASYVSVDIYRADGSKLVASRRKLLNKSSDSFNEDISFNLPTSTKILTGVTSIPAGWNTLSFADSAWATYVSEPAMTSTSRIVLVRSTFTVTPTSDTQGWQLNYRTNAGTIVYLDGTEIIRFQTTEPAGTTLSTTSTASASDYSYAWRTLTGVMSQLTAGSHVFSIAMIAKYNSFATDPINFDCFLRFLADSNTNSRTWNMDSKQSSVVWDDSKADKLFDSNYNTRFATWFRASNPAPQWGAGNLEALSFEVFNKYCIVSGWDAPQHDPKKITLSASTGSWDEIAFEIIDAQEDIVFDGRSQRICFYMPTVTKAYNIFKISALETNVAPPDNDRFYLAELEFYLIDFNKLTIPPLAYSASSVTGYTNSQITSLYPTSEYYRQFTTTPALPAGITLSASTGIISGTPTAPSSGTYTISATGITGTATTVSVTITIQACTLPNVFFKVVFTGMDDANAYQNGFSLSNMAGQVIDKLDTFPNYLLTGLTRGYCQPSGAYSLILKDAFNDGWNNAKVTVYNYDDIIILQDTLLSGDSSKTLYINVGYLVAFGQSSWKYTSTVQSDAAWAATTFSDATWSTAQAGSFTGLTGTTVYYRTTFTVNNLEQFSLYELSLKIKSGVIAYINGKEVYRYAVPTTGVTSSTLATSEFDDVTVVTSSESAQYGSLVNGQNVLAVEIHRYGPSQETTFDAQVVLQLSGNNRVSGGTVKTNVPGLNTDQWHETEDKAFDRNMDTKYYAQGCGQTIWLEYIYNYNRKEYVSSVAVSRANNWNRKPTAFILSASNDGINYITLTCDFNMTFGNYKSAAGTKTYDFFNNVAYNRYRFTFDTRSCSEGVEISELALTSKRIDISCVASSIWGPAVEGGYSFQECPNGYLGVKRRLCTAGVFGDEQDLCYLTAPSDLSYIDSPFTLHKNIFSSIPATIFGAELTYTIDPVLPNGLTINQINGMISGIPTTNSDITTYTVTATNEFGSVSTTIFIYIDVVFCISEDNWSITEIGQEASLPCEDPINYEGSRTRLCQIGYPAIWGDIINNCELRKPSIIYTVPTTIGYKNIPITPITALITGSNLNPLTISPSLPNGLLFNSITGLIYGTPTTTTSSSSVLYTITISNPRGESTATITITIKDSSCPIDDIWPITEAGEQAILDCEDTINYEGFRTRLCIRGDPAVWGDIINNCQLLLPTISYATNTIIGNKNNAITPVAATITGGNLNPLTISPSLPDGLIFNTENGQIYGIPTSDSSNTYTITISNSKGQSTATITITISASNCISDDIWPITEAGQQITLPCEDTINYEGFRTRLCKLEYPAVWGDIINNCQLKMPSIIYDITTITGYKNVAINSVNATITGSNLNSITINPSLPDGLVFNTENGQIYGTPTSSSSGSYVITVSNTRGEDNIVINIIISTFNCISDDIWPITEAGEQVTLPCEDPINYEGFRTRLCLLGNPAVWEDAVNNCQLKNPSISYTTTTITGYKNIGITPIMASITGGNLNPLTISPSLPDGLILNNQNGQIYGTPTSDSSNTYTITISNSRGEYTTTITIIISIANCPDDIIWPITEIGNQVTLPCEDPINYEGFRTRLCKLGYPAVWGDIINNCELKIPSISYNTNTIIGYKNDIITPIMASITGGNLNPLTISPSLPDGLIFNTQNGFIYGIPTSASSNSYTITASNARGESTATITITISIVYCPSDDNWPITERDITAYIECPSGQLGIQSRVCQNTGVGTASWQIADSSDCYIFITNENPGDNKIFIDVPIKLEGLTETAFNTPSTTETFRTLIVQSLTSYSIPSSAVKIISVSSISTYTDGVSVNVRITANQADEDNIKNDINTLFTGIDSILLKACKTSNDSNLQNITNTSINGKIKEKKEKKLQPHKKTPEIETVKVEKPVTL
ncbi:hypothetical protein WA158_002621 [Blastocystis sp. Blastoise]